MPFLELSRLSCGSRAVGVGILRRPPKDMGIELMAMLDCWHRAKALSYETSAVFHALTKIADEIKSGVGREIPPLPEAHYLVSIPFLYLQNARFETSLSARDGNYSSSNYVVTDAFLLAIQSAKGGAFVSGVGSKKEFPGYIQRSPGLFCQWGNGSLGHSHGAGTSAVRNRLCTLWCFII